MWMRCYKVEGVPFLGERKRELSLFFRLVFFISLARVVVDVVLVVVVVMFEIAFEFKGRPTTSRG